jgi:hypothetical protein
MKMSYSNPVTMPGIPVLFGSLSKLTYNRAKNKYLFSRADADEHNLWLML